MGGDERGISDAVGFVLVFGIIVSTIAVIYVAGFGNLNDAKQFERMNNAERAFDVLGDNIEDLTIRGAPSRATEIKLAEASLGAGDPVVVNVSVHQTGAPAEAISYNITMAPMVFKASDENRMIYSMGAVFRESVGGVSMTRRPGIRLGTDEVIIPVIQTRSLSQSGISGSTTALARTELSTRDVLIANTTAGATSEVTLNMTTPRADRWRTYLSESSGVTCPPAVNTDSFVSCEVSSVDRVFVTFVAIDFEYTN